MDEIELSVETRASRLTGLIRMRDDPNYTSAKKNILSTEISVLGSEIAVISLRGIRFMLYSFHIEICLTI
jgi:hypothetical protein